MPFIERDGTKLVYEEAGTGAPAFVFVHGWTCNRSYFAPQFEHFSHTHRAVAVDLRGHGESDAPHQDYSVAGFADDLAWLCGQIGVTQAVFVGHSMGGAIVLELAARHPALALAVVMIDAAPISASPEMAAIADSLAEALQSGEHAAARTAIVDGLLSQVRDDEALKARIKHDMSAIADHVAASCIQQMATWDGEAAARACKVPVLHIGADDPINDAAALRALNPLIRTGQTVGAGHFNQLEVPSQVNSMIERFLAVDL